MIWFDLDNSPHVPIFRYIFRELEKIGVEYIITARDYAQTKELLDLWHIPYKLIGQHGGKNKIKKLINIYNRSSQLRQFIKDKKVKLALSHGSRSQVIAAKKLGIKSILMLDYEYTESKIFNYFADLILMPQIIPTERLTLAGINLKKIIRYNGLKEDIYINEFIPEENFRSKLNIDEEEILITVRPPNMEGNYHNKKSEYLLIDSLKYFSEHKNLKIAVLCRTKKDKDWISKFFNYNNSFLFPSKAIDGLQLLFHSDLALSGGGTMSREAALLETKAYSFFTGKRPFVDEYLESKGKITFLRNSRDIYDIPIKRRVTKKLLLKNRDVNKELVEIILNNI